MTDENITILVNMHAILRHLAQEEVSGPMELSVPRNTRLGGLLPLLKLPSMEVVYSVNSMISEAEVILSDGDRVDIIPAISGGAC